MWRQSDVDYPISKVRFKDCVVCHYFDKKYFIRKIGNHWRYCEAYINQFLGDNETKNVEQENIGWAQRTVMYQQSNHGKKQRILYGYKDILFKSNPDPTLEYSVANVVANECLSIEDDEHLLYWVKGNISLFALVFNSKVQNQLIMYLQGQVITEIWVAIFWSWKNHGLNKIWSSFSLFFTPI